MPNHDLNSKERAVLLTLLAEGRELTNADLLAVAGLKLDGVSRLRLNDLKLVDSEKRGRSFVHALTEDGAAWCTRELAAERPARSGAFGGALYAILGSLHRYLLRGGQHLTEIFQPEATDDLPARIRTSYARLREGSGEAWVSLVSLRDVLPGEPRGEVDAALEELSLTPGVHLQPEANQQSLTAADHEASIRLGGSDRHLLKIERP